MSETIINLEKVYKSYTFSGKQKPSFGRFFAGNTDRNLWALKNINLNLRKGSRIGVLGPNGSGKSTLLRIIAGITSPTSGKVFVNGRVAMMANLEAGFHPELTGSENIYINGALMGLNEGFIRKKYDKIVEFSGIGEFMDAPFYTYSDGMKFRLAFSLAVNGEFDILILDEVFVSGDIEFQKKTLSALKELQEEKGVTTLVCSHIPRLVLSLSDKYYRMEKGEISEYSGREMQHLAKEREKMWKQSLKRNQ